MRRRRAVAAGAVALVSAVVALAVILTTTGSSTRGGDSEGAAVQRHGGRSGHSGASGSSRASETREYTVGLRIVRLVDASRTITLPDGTTEPRPLVTEVFYPVLGPAGAAATPSAAPASGEGPFPLVIFGHGYDVTPKLYARLLEAWARAGYVVAAPVFPLENAHAPGGPDESDLVNQPADMRFVISSLLSLGQSGSGALSGLIDPSAIAVTGQSDGGDTALAVAYDARYRDPRVGAAVILSGAEIPALGSFTFPPGGPPLLAVQGTADTVNPPSETEAFFAAARPPKYLLRLIGAEHLRPYSAEQPQLTVVERVTTAFLDRYLKHDASGPARMRSAGTAPGTATLLAEP